MKKRAPKNPQLPPNAKPTRRLHLRVTEAGQKALKQPPVIKAKDLIWHDPFSNPETWPHP